MRSFTNFLKNNYVLVSLISIIVGLVIAHYASDVELESKKVMVCVGEICEAQTYLYPKRIYLILNLISNGFIPFGFTLLITMFFVRKFEEQENEELKNKLLQFQRDTAENAMNSVFKTMIDPSFFYVIRNDVLNCRLIRKNAKWIYDVLVDKTSGSLKMKRTISYTLENLSSEKQIEPVAISAMSSDYVKSNVTKLQFRLQQEKVFNDLEISIDESVQDKKVGKATKDIEIEGKQSVEIVKEIEQEFSKEFIYETHFANSPLTDLEIQINFPEDYDFRLSCDALSQEYETTIDEPSRKVIRFKNAILKGQGIEFYCSKKKRCLASAIHSIFVGFAVIASFPIMDC